VNKNFSLIQYYLILLGFNKWIPNSLVLIENIRFENLNFEIKIPIVFVSYCSTIEFTNFFFSNMTCSKFQYGQTSIDMFVMQIGFINYVLFNAIFFIHNNIYSATATIRLYSIYLFKISHSKIGSDLPEKNIRKFTVVALLYFSYAIFENNNIFDMSSKNNPFYVWEQTGAISILGMDSFELDKGYSYLQFTSIPKIT
jgi:hypothetical protein